MGDHAVVSIDAMGGDHGPCVVVPAIALARDRLAGARFLLHGDQAVIETELARHPSAAAVCEVRHTDKSLTPSDKPHQALRRGKGTSLWNALACVRSGEAGAALSAGDTGAMMAISKLLIGTIAGLDRPAIVARWPGKLGVKTVLDLGANIECDATQLVEFAVMGAAFHRAMTGTPRPTVALLNIGSEDQKGRAAVREAHATLRAARLELDYVGFVEGSDISLGAVNVVVTDGFTGNIALKTAEGSLRYLSGEIKAGLMSGPFAALGGLLASRALAGVRARIDPGRSNGAPLLGLNGIVIKSHGGADIPAFAAAIGVASSLAGGDLLARIANDLEGVAVKPRLTRAVGAVDAAE